MNRLALLAALTLALPAAADERSVSTLTYALAPTGSAGDAGIVLSRKGDRETAKGPAANFTGDVLIEPLFAAADQIRASGASVSFALGARTVWHSHPLGQTLIVTAGTGWVQQWGKPKQEITVGDVVRVAPGVKHWHGATLLDGMTHVAVQEHVNGKVVDWMEPVTEEQYRGTSSNTQHITPFTGVWKMNQSKSTFEPGPAYRSFTLTFTPDGARHLELVRGNGEPFKAALPWSDGKTVKVALQEGETGNLEAISKLDGRTFADTWKDNGKVIEKVQGSLSPDGTTMTVNVQGPTARGGTFQNRLVFDKQ